MFAKLSLLLVALALANVAVADDATKYGGKASYLRSIFDSLLYFLNRCQGDQILREALRRRETGRQGAGVHDIPHGGQREGQQARKVLDRIH